MRIWIDGDACPNVIKDILYRAAERAKVPMVLVANAMLRPPPSKYISTIRVGAGLDMADEEIARRCERGDLVITADIPLAANVIARGAFALDPRGELFTEETITERLSMRNFMSDLRSSGIETGGPSALNRKDHQAFANALDRFLTQWLNTRKPPAEKAEDTGRN